MKLALSVKWNTWDELELSAIWALYTESNSCSHYLGLNSWYVKLKWDQNPYCATSYYTHSIRIYVRWDGTAVFVEIIRTWCTGLQQGWGIWTDPRLTEDTLPPLSYLYSTLCPCSPCSFSSVTSRQHWNPLVSDVQSHEQECLMSTRVSLAAFTSVKQRCCNVHLPRGVIPPHVCWLSSCHTKVSVQPHHNKTWITLNAAGEL